MAALAEDVFRAGPSGIEQGEGFEVLMGQIGLKKQLDEGLVL